jgi:quinol monooxygenase YgiN
MPGCFGYVVAKDSVDENVIWVTEVWDSVASHDASLLLPAVKNPSRQGSGFGVREDGGDNSRRSNWDRADERALNSA